MPNPSLKRSAVVARLARTLGSFKAGAVVLTYHKWYRHNMVCGASRNTVAWTSRPQARPPRS
jgi:hypothetical protein